MTKAAIARLELQAEPRAGGLVRVVIEPKFGDGGLTNGDKRMKIRTLSVTHSRTQTVTDSFRHKSLNLIRQSPFVCLPFPFPG